jgi:hypothetical protein
MVGASGTIGFVRDWVKVMRSPIHLYDALASVPRP